MLIYFVIASIVVAVVLGWNFASRIKPHFYNEILPNLSQYIDYLVEDIGTPPDLKRATELSSKLPFELRIEGKDVEWSSTPELKPISYHLFESAPFPYQKYAIGHLKRSHLLLVESDHYRYLFVIDNNFRRGASYRHWILFLLLCSVLTILYFGIRRLFYPIRDISEHLKKIGGGALDQPLKLKGRNELSMLAAGINDMTLKIRTMLESKASLLLAISHELRSPITRMRVNIELLDDSRKKDLLLKDIREMEYLVATILESERLNSDHSPLIRSRFDMAELIKEVIHEHFESCEIIFSAESAFVYMDTARIKLLVKNLIDNACRYSAESNRPVHVNLEMNADILQLTVIDHGPGVNTDDLLKLADPFYRTDGARQRKTGGYGLGLYLCRLITDAHDGSILFESEPGRGLTVLVKLPLLDADNQVS